MRFLKFEDFSGEVGEAFEVLRSEGALTLKLEEAEALPGSPREGGAFRLVFRGPTQTPLDQGAYTFRRNGDEDEIFIVPVASNQDGVEYEAIFS
jgi:hypothetical protein